MARAGHEVGNGVEAGAVRHGRGVGNGVLRRDGVHVVEIGQPHGHEVAVRDHHALGPAGGAAGVEQPGGVGGRALGHGGQARAVFQPGGAGHGIGVDHAVQPRQRGGVGQHVGGDEGPARLGVVHDPLHLFGVQLGVHRHHHQPGPPGAEQQLQVPRVVAHEQHDPVARHQASRQEVSTCSRGALCPLAMGGDTLGAEKQGRPGRVLQGRAFEQVGQVHGCASRRWIWLPPIMAFAFRLKARQPAA